MGISEIIPKGSRRRIAKANQILLIIFAFVLLSAFFALLQGLYYSFGIYAITIGLLIVAFRLNSMQRFVLSKNLSIANANFNILFINLVEGTKAGNYNYFFPYFLVVAFVVNVEKQKKALAIYYLQAVICAVMCFGISPERSELQRISDTEYSIMFFVNQFLALLVTLVFSYMIIRVNKTNERNIFQQKKYFNTIFNTASDSILIVNDRNNTVENCNRTALKMFEIIDSDCILNTSIHNWVHEEHDGKFTKGLVAIESGETAWHDELMLTKQSGEVFFAYVHMLRFSYKGDMYKKINVLDISDIKSAEFDLMQEKEKAQSATRAKSRFLSSMSHELRTPLNGIIGSTNLLLQENYLPEQRKSLDILRYSSEHMLHLINHILDFSKIEEDKVELEESVFNIKNTLNKITPQFTQHAANKSIKLETDILEDIDIDVLADETRLYQVISNLLSNAIKFTQKGGVVFTVKKVFTSSHIASIQFLVTDTGIGIPVEKQNEVFKNFVQADSTISRKYGGTGLGLSICKKLLQMMGADLFVESEEGKGSTFYFTIEFKVSQERRSYINEEQHKDLRPLTGARILLAEDNAINMCIAKSFLEKWGVEVTEAVNGRMAVELFEKGKFDLALIDLEMPELDGLATLRRIRSIDATISAIAFTAAVYDNIQLDLMQKGFSDFLHKPFRPEDLHKKISKHLSEISTEEKRA